MFCGAVRERDLPCLELTAGPLEAVIWVPETMETGEEDVELRIGCCHDNHFGLQLSEYGRWDLVEDRRVQMFYTAVYHYMYCHTVLTLQHTTKGQSPPVAGQPQLLSLR